MTAEVRMEGLMLTVDDVARSVDFHCNQLCLFTLEWNAAPQFAILRILGGAATLGLLSWAQAESDGAVRLSRSQASAIHVELRRDHRAHSLGRPSANWSRNSMLRGGVADAGAERQESGSLVDVANDCSGR